MPRSPLLFYAAAGALIWGGIGGGRYFLQRGHHETAKRLQHEDADAAKEALRDAIDLADLRRQAQAAGLDPDEVVAGYQGLRDSPVSPEDLLEMLNRAAITDLTVSTYGSAARRVVRGPMLRPHWLRLQNSCSIATS